MAGYPYYGTYVDSSSDPVQIPFTCTCRRKLTINMKTNYGWNDGNHSIMITVSKY